MCFSEGCLESQQGALELAPEGSLPMGMLLYLAGAIRRCRRLSSAATASAGLGLLDARCSFGLCARPFMIASQSRTRPINLVG